MVDARVASWRQRLGAGLVAVGIALGIAPRAAQAHDAETVPSGILLLQPPPPPGLRAPPPRLPLPSAGSSPPSAARSAQPDFVKTWDEWRGPPTHGRDQ